MERPKIPETISAYRVIEKQLTLFEYEALLSQKVTAVFFGFSSTNFQDDRSTFPFFFLGPLNLVRVIVKFSFPSLPSCSSLRSSGSDSGFVFFLFFSAMPQTESRGGFYVGVSDRRQKPTLTALKNPTEKKRREREL